MLELWHRVVIGSAIVVYLLALVGVSGIALRHMRVDERAYRAVEADR